MSRLVEHISLSALRQQWFVFFCVCFRFRLNEMRLWLGRSQHLALSSHWLMDLQRDSFDLRMEKY